MTIVNFSKKVHKFIIQQEIADRKKWIKYLTVDISIIDGNILTGNPGQEFNDIVNKYVNNYIFEKKMPPAEITTAVMNIADDYLNDREIVLKAGDYIAIQGFIRNTVKTEK